MTMESLQKEGKMTEVGPGAVQLSPERQQMIGIKFGTVEMKTPGEGDPDHRQGGL